MAGPRKGKGEGTVKSGARTTTEQSAGHGKCKERFYKPPLIIIIVIFVLFEKMPCHAQDLVEFSQ